MSYKYSKGSQVIGDLKAADDAERNTMIDFGEDQIDFQTGGLTRLKIENNEITTTVPIHISGSQTEGLRIGKAGNHFREIQFETDGVDTAFIQVDSSEGMVIGCQSLNDEIIIQTTDGGGLGEVARFTANKRVGIGETNPQETLHVSGGTIIESDLKVNMNILDYENKSFIKNIDTGGFLASAPNTNTLRLPNDTTSESTTGVNYNTIFVCPFSGSVDKLIIRSSNDALGGSLADLGDLTASVQIGFDGKDGYLIDSNPDAEETVAIANAQLGANTNIVFNFTGSNFSPSDVFSVSLKPTNNWNNNGNKYINFTIVSSYLLD